MAKRGRVRLAHALALFFGGHSHEPWSRVQAPFLLDDALGTGHLSTAHIVLESYRMQPVFVVKIHSVRVLRPLAGMKRLP